MSNPNIVAVTHIYGNTSTTALSNTSETSIVNNASSSGKIYKINSIVIANSSTSTAYGITINVRSAASLGGTAYPLASVIYIPANASLIVTDKTTAFYLLEDKSIGAIASTGGYLTVTASWEEIDAA